MFGELSGLMAALLFAVANILVRSQSDRIDMLSVNALRLLVASPIALAAPLLLGGGGDDQASLMSWLYILVGALVSLVIGDTIYYKSQKTLGVSRALPVANIYPIWTLILAALFLNEQPTWTLGAAVVLVFVGVYLLAQEQRAASGEDLVLERGDVRLGLVLAGVSGVCWAIGTTFFRQGLLELSFTSANQIRIPAMALVLVSAGYVMGRPIRWGSYSRRTLSLIAVVGILGMGVASLLFLYSVQTLGATEASLLSSLAPFFGAPLAALFLGERITLRRGIGMACCVAAVWLIIMPTGP